MFEKRAFPRSKSIRLRLLALFLGINALAVLIVTAIGAYSSLTVSSQSQKISSQTIRQQAETYLVQLTLAHSKDYDHSLERISQHAQTAAAYLGTVYSSPREYGSQEFWVPHAHMAKGTDGQWANGTQDISSVFVPNFKSHDDAVLQDIELSAYLDPYLKPVIENNPSVDAIYFSTKNDVTRYFPNINLGKVLPPDFQVAERVWYKGSIPENNPEHLTWWTSPYVDATGRGVVTTVAAPVYSKNGTFIGVIGVDLGLDEMKTSIESTTLMENGYSFLMDKEGQAIAFPANAYEDILNREQKEDEVSPNLLHPVAEFLPIINKMLARESGFEVLEVDGRELFVAYAPIANTGWSIGNVIPSENVLKDVVALQNELNQTTWTNLLKRTLPIIGIIFVVLAIAGFIFFDRLIRPIQTLATAAQKVGEGSWEIGRLPYREDEIGVLSETFQKMTRQLQGLVTGLENRVMERTRDLEQRTIYLQVAAEVAREAATIRELEELLDNTVKVISERFGFYHAGIFLLDEPREYAIFRAASSEGGQRMLEHGHKLRVGQTGIVGYVASEGKSRVALDVGADAVFFNNPNLPETRSEAALPLKVADLVIGVLDVQSKKSNAFKFEDIEILQILADQVALAIENARLIASSELALQELEAVYRRQVRQDWGKRLEVRSATYVYDRMGVQPARLTSPISDPVDPYTLTIPIELRGERLGFFQLQREVQDGPWQEEEKELAKETLAQLGQALESARLFEEIQARATREKVINQMTASISRSLDVETLLQTALSELGRLPDVAEVSVHLGGPEEFSQEKQSPRHQSTNSKLSRKNGSKETP